MVALNSSSPSEKERDVLAFPEGAEIQEVQNHNGGWFSGVYCGKEGSFLATWASNTADYATDSAAPKLPPRHQDTEPGSLDRSLGTAKGSQILPYRHRPTAA